jgi:hypothetical protein
VAKPISSTVVIPRLRRKGSSVAFFSTLAPDRPTAWNSPARGTNGSTNRAPSPVQVPAFGIAARRPETPSPPLNSA